LSNTPRSCNDGPTSYGVNLTVEELVFARGDHLEHEALDLAEDLYAKSPRR
jgi:hypothetical protein